MKRPNTNSPNIKHFHHSRSRRFHQTSRVVHRDGRMPTLARVAGTYRGMALVCSELFHPVSQP